jgi:hypothetical protein
MKNRGCGEADSKSSTVNAAGVEIALYLRFDTRIRLHIGGQISG